LVFFGLPLSSQSIPDTLCGAPVEDVYVIFGKIIKRLSV